MYIYKGIFIEQQDNLALIKLDYGFRTYQEQLVSMISATQNFTDPIALNLTQGGQYLFRTYKPKTNLSNGLQSDPDHYTAQLRTQSYPSYMYKAYVPTNGIIDGDTFDCIIDVGFNLTFGMRVRMQGINAPERYSQAGILATQWLTSQLADKEIILRTWQQTQQTEKYGRYLATVYLPTNLDSNGNIINSNLSINAAAIQAGKANYYSGHTDPTNINIFNRS